MIHIVKDNTWYCACCENKSVYRIDFYEDDVKNHEELHLCEDHKYQLASTLVKY